MQGLSVYPYESTTMKGVYETLSAIRPFEFARLKLKGEYRSPRFTTIILFFLRRG